MKVNERRTVVGGGLIGHCVSPQPWREIDAHGQNERSDRPSWFIINIKLLGVSFFTCSVDCDLFLVVYFIRSR